MITKRKIGEAIHKILIKKHKIDFNDLSKLIKQFNCSIKDIRNIERNSIFMYDGRKAQ